MSQHILSRLLSRNFNSIRRISYIASNSNILYLKDRGLIQQIFPAEKLSELTKALIGSPQTVYCGFDPTADSLHIGNLLSLLTLMHCYRGGHQAIAVIGTATAQIGDPSGRTTERDPLSESEVFQNAESLKESINQLFANCREYYGEGGRRKLLDPLILCNDEWYKEVRAVEFLCKVGRHFRMGSMLSRQSVQKRLKSPEGMSLTEFMYQVFQACDWLHLYKHHNCRLQVGGNDQTGNIISGHDLIHHVTGKSNLFGITTPLVTNTAGNKLGKSAGNAIWLDPKKTTPFEFFQYFVRLPDADVENYLRLFTFLSDESFRDIMLKHRETPENRIAQNSLAHEVTRLVHGKTGLQSALRCTDALYKGTPEHLTKLSIEELESIFSNAATVELFLEPGTTVCDSVVKAKCFRDVADAERVIKAGGVYINHRRIVEPDFVLVPGEHILSNNLSVVRVGKKNYYLIRWLGGL